MYNSNMDTKSIFTQTDCDIYYEKAKLIVKNFEFIEKFWQDREKNTIKRETKTNFILICCAIVTFTTLLYKKNVS